MCECTHGDKQHEDISFWNSSKPRKCLTCECPKYIRDSDTIGFYIECKEADGEMVRTSRWTGCKTFYKKVKDQ